MLPPHRAERNANARLCRSFSSHAFASIYESLNFCLPILRVFLLEGTVAVEEGATRVTVEVGVAVPDGEGDTEEAERKFAQERSHRIACYRRLRIVAVNDAAPDRSSRRQIRAYRKGLPSSRRATRLKRQANVDRPTSLEPPRETYGVFHTSTTNNHKPIVTPPPRWQTPLNHSTGKIQDPSVHSPRMR